MGKLRRPVLVALLAVLALTLAVRGAAVNNRDQALVGTQLADWMGPGVPPWCSVAPLLADWMGPGVPPWASAAPAMLADWMGPGVPPWYSGVTAFVAQTASHLST